jgi:hypothetical protein
LDRIGAAGVKRRHLAAPTKIANKDCLEFGNGRARLDRRARLLDYSGAFNAYNLTANTCQSEFTFGDFNAGTGNACTAMTCN